ncbi:MAG: hypothetical protein ACKOCX_05575 [Planctomycetota bacterium]
MCRFTLTGPLLAVALLSLACPSIGSDSQGGEPRDVLAAAAAGEVEVRFIPNDSRSAQIVVKNVGDRPLTLRLPAAFAGVPVLAQMGMGGMGQGVAGFGGAGIGGAPQNVGGGGMQNAGMGIGGAMGGGGFCWVAREVYGVHDQRWLAFRQWMTWRAPAWLQDLYRQRGEEFSVWLRERPVAKTTVRIAMDRAIAETGDAPAGGLLRVATAAGDAHAKPFSVSAGQTLAIRVPTVCLEYGRREPTPRMPYRLEPLTKVSGDPKLDLLLGGLASGHLTQKVAQAAAWHIASGRSWEQLAAEVVDHAGGDRDPPMFTAAELAAAKQAVEAVTRLTAEAPAAASAGTSGN